MELKGRCGCHLFWSLLTMKDELLVDQGAQPLSRGMPTEVEVVTDDQRHIEDMSGNEMDDEDYSSAHLSPQVTAVSLNCRCFEVEQHHLSYRRYLRS